MGAGHGGYTEGQPMQYPNQELTMEQQLPHPQMQVSPQPMEIGESSQIQSTEELNKNGMNKCLDFSKRFEECMKLNFNNTSICAQMFEDLKKCQGNV
jgi:hypothetical protein